jgi:hypothetical protein
MDCLLIVEGRLRRIAVSATMELALNGRRRAMPKTGTSQPGTTLTAASASTQVVPAGGGAATKAAASVTAQHATHLHMPGIAHLELPPADQLAFLGGVAVLAVLGIVEWPVAGVLAVGHLLAHNRHHALLRDFGEALDKA